MVKLVCKGAIKMTPYMHVQPRIIQHDSILACFTLLRSKQSTGTAAAPPHASICIQHSMHMPYPCIMTFEPVHLPSAHSPTCRANASARLPPRRALRSPRGCTSTTRKMPIPSVSTTSQPVHSPV
eukprot:1139494-Pelagomonas_calceolata.AAC.3